ncbi:MAG: ferrochelatase [Bacteroidia bacterium]
MIKDNLKTGVLLINLGTPDKPEEQDVKIYLKEFLNDPRVIDIPDFSRYLLVNYIIIPKRYKNTTRLYKEVWTDNGSPLMFYTMKSAKLLQEKLGDKFDVQLAMRYRLPSIESALKKFKNNGIGRIIILPLFPQYASASVGTVHQKVMKIISGWQVIPDIKFISEFHDHPQYIKACCDVSTEFNLNEFDHFLFSYHGLPERQIKKADQSGICLNDKCCNTIDGRNLYCYRAQCYSTTRLIAQQLNIKEENYSVCFQSRLGKEPWIKPYTDKVLIDLAAKGKKKLLVFSPSFVADCLETLYEIGVEFDELFKENGGEKVQLVPGLNDHPQWITALKEIILNN